MEGSKKGNHVFNNLEKTIENVYITIMSPYIQKKGIYHTQWIKREDAQKKAVEEVKGHLPKSLDMLCEVLSMPQWRNREELMDEEKVELNDPNATAYKTEVIKFTEEVRKYIEMEPVENPMKQGRKVQPDFIAAWDEVVRVGYDAKAEANMRREIKPKNLPELQNKIDQFRRFVQEIRPKVNELIVAMKQDKNKM